MPIEKFSSQPLNGLRFLSGQVMRFARVGSQIIQLRFAAILLREKFQISFTNGEIGPRFLLVPRPVRRPDPKQRFVPCLPGLAE